MVFLSIVVCLVAADLYSVSFAFLWCFNDNLAYKETNLIRMKIQILKKKTEHLA
jgi:hypothetical protein